MDPHHLLHRGGKHAKWIVGAQVCLGGKGEMGKIFKRLQVVRVDTFGIECLSVMGHVCVGVVQAPPHALQL